MVGKKFQQYYLKLWFNGDLPWYNPQKIILNKCNTFFFVRVSLTGVHSCTSDAPFLATFQVSGDSGTKASQTDSKNQG